MLGIAAGLAAVNILAVGALSNARNTVELVGFAFGGVFFWPLVIFGIAAIWKRNRSLRRAVLIFNIVSVFVPLSLLMQNGHRGTAAVASAKTTATLSPEGLERLKRAVAYVVVEEGSRGRSGTGFLIDKDDETGVLVTNAHVVQPDKRDSVPKVDVVFGSGEGEEQRLQARVAALDRAADLAILTVRSADLPEPIALSRTPEFAQTQDVLILGYPFGDALASNSQTPAITIGKGIVSSNRKDANGQIGLVQIDGDLNPGNSGGPIVTSAGELVGVARAEVRSTNIGFAVPSWQVGELLHGRFSGLKSSKFGEIVTVYADLADPYGEVAEGSFHIIGADLQAVVGARRADGSWGGVPGRDYFYPFEPREYGDYVAKFSYAPLVGPSRYAVKHWIGQVVLKMKDGSFAYQAPFRIMVEDSGSAFYMGGPGVLNNDTERYIRRFEQDKGGA